VLSVPAPAHPAFSVATDDVSRGAHLPFILRGLLGEFDALPIAIKRVGCRASIVRPAGADWLDVMFTLSFGLKRESDH